MRNAQFATLFASEWILNDLAIEVINKRVSQIEDEGAAQWEGFEGSVVST